MIFILIILCSRTHTTPFHQDAIVLKKIADRAA